MDALEYRKDLLNQLRFQADHNSSDVQAQFVTWTLDKLEEYGELLDPYPFECNMYGSNRRKLAFDAYAFDEADSSIVLLLTEFNNSIERKNMIQSRINELY